MRGRSTVLAICAFLTSCQRTSPSNVIITGDSTSVGAQILVDGLQVGVMERHVMSYGPDRVFGAAFVKIDRGARSIEFISTQADTVRFETVIEGETYWGMSFPRPPVAR